MKIAASISDEMYEAIRREAKTRLVSESHVIREIIGAAYSLPVGAPRKPGWFPDPLLVHSHIPNGANI